MVETKLADYTFSSHTRERIFHEKRKDYFSNVFIEERRLSSEEAASRGCLDVVKSHQVYYS